MAQIQRRQFLQTLAAAATVTISGTKSSGQVVGANEAIRIGIAGLNGRGADHVGGYLPMPNVRIAYLIDPDTRTYAARLRTIRDRDAAANPQTVSDVRRALEDRNLDAISIATPNHWHALMTIWGAQAGKHVYVEKPCSHNVHEGRIAADMARRHNVIVQHGTQSRSGGWNNTIAVVRSGAYGKLLVSQALVYKRRNSINTQPASAAPTELDFDLWTGPAQRTAFHRNLVHYNWHWFWDFGNGDIGNQGVHQMDIARWAIDGATLPRSVASVGGRFGYTDQGETPNTQITLMDFGETKLLFEVRGLPTPSYRTESIGNIFHLEQGIVAGGRFYPRGDMANPQPLARPANAPAARPGGASHYANFIAAVRERRRETLNADILEGHYSSALCHLANISYRLGENAPFNERTQAFGDNREAGEAYTRMLEHLRTNNIPIDGQNYRVGPNLAFDARTERFTNNDAANRLLTRQYRDPFTVPDRVN